MKKYSKHFLYLLLLSPAQLMSMSGHFTLIPPQANLVIPLPLLVPEQPDENMEIGSDSDTEIMYDSDSEDDRNNSLDSMDMDRSASTTRVPAEIWEYITSFTGQSIPIMRLVSHMHRQLADRHLTHLTLDINDLTTIQFPVDYEKKAARFLRVKKLKLTSNNNQLLTHAQLVLLIDNFPALEHLDISTIRVTCPEPDQCAGAFALLEDELINLRELVVQSSDIFSENFSIENKQKIQKLIIKNKNNGNITQAQLAKLGKTYTSLTYLNISKLKIISENDSHWLWVFSEQFSNLTHLDISYTNDVEDGGIYLLHQALCQQKLVYLGLARTRLTDEDIQAFAVPGIFSSLSQLNIAHNTLGNDAIEYLAEAPFAQQLTYLNLEGNNIFGTGITLLAAPGKFPELTHLNLANNKIVAIAVQDLAVSLFARQLIYLNLAFNNITPTSIWELVQPERFINLRELILSGNSNIASREAQALTQAPFAQNLEVLDLTHTGVNAEILVSQDKYFPKLKKT